ncbi:hypothetical protein [Natronobiforma cellulositropha]|uniref:hypothetical protein n=1 Tax=Natronobiforma cellulositropha TaxID=1679076 RepID=UPI0021D60D65|nr:hypothetical protein [Natronobiforma cellulositropha]
MSPFSLAEYGRRWFEDAIDTVIEWFQEGLTQGYSELTQAFFGTPVPQTDGAFVFGTPTNEPWIGLYAALVGGEIVLLALLLLVISVQARHTIRIFNVGSSYEARKAQRSAWVGTFLIVTWYWVAVLALYLVNGFSLALVPSLDVLMNDVVRFLEVSITNPMLALLMASIGGLAMWILQALFFIRDILLYIYLYAMPLALALAYGRLPVVSQIARRLCIQFVPLAIMPLPVAILFRGYELLFSSGPDSSLAPASAFFSYLVAVLLPVLALVLVWKLFRYASPLTTRIVGGTTRVALTAGTVAGAAYVAGPAVATTAATWGPKAAAGHTAAQTLATQWGDGDRRSSSPHTRGTTHDNVAPDAHGQYGVAAYRRTENDPGYY